MTSCDWYNIVICYREPDAMAARLRDWPGTPTNYQHGAEWFANFLATCLEPGDAPELHEITDGAGGPPLLLPLRRRLRPVGPFRASGLASLTNCYTCSYLPLGLGGISDGDTRLAAWASALRNRTERPCWMTFEALDEATAGSVMSTLAAAGYPVERSPGFGNWFLPAPAGDQAPGNQALGNQAWWSSRSSRLRSTVERKERALRRDHGAVTLERLVLPAEAERAVAAYETVETVSWKSREPYPGFMPGLIRTGLSARRLEVSTLTVAGSVVAVQVWLIANGKATLFKLNHDEAFRKYSPGSILTRWLIDLMLECDTIREIDFGRGDDPYKREWMPERRQYWRVDAYEPRTPLGLMLAARNLVPRLVRRSAVFSGLCLK